MRQPVKRERQGRDDTAEAGRSGENLQKGGKGLPAAKKYLIIMRYILDQSVSCCLIRRIKDKKSNHKKPEAKKIEDKKPVAEKITDKKNEAKK